jgi:AraC family transcriptional regulator
MLTNPLRQNRTSFTPFDRAPAPPHGLVPTADRRRSVGYAREESPHRNPSSRAHDHGATDAIDPAVSFSPPNAVKRRQARWTGMAAEIVQTTDQQKIESRFCAPVHLLVAHERAVRQDGQTCVQGLPVSGLRDLRRKLTFVPAGHQYGDWQESRASTRVAYFYFDPRELPISPEIGFSDMSFAPRLFFEASGLWDTALKLTALIESGGPENQLYREALGIVLAHELVRLDAGTPSVEPLVRGGLAAWQQRIVAAYIEEHLADPISLATLARLVRLSPYYFCRAFKQSFGMPPHRYHGNRRIERAKMLLAKPKPSVTDVGFAVGFGQTSSFTAAFRRTTGLTPSAYHRSFG